MENCAEQIEHVLTQLMQDMQRAEARNLAAETAAATESAVDLVTPPPRTGRAIVDPESVGRARELRRMLWQRVKSQSVSQCRAVDSTSHGEAL